MPKHLLAVHHDADGPDLSPEQAELAFAQVDVLNGHEDEPELVVAHAPHVLGAVTSWLLEDRHLPQQLLSTRRAA